ncbi:GZF1 [Mytilus coruscus]|uniref:GZF1 n=1 Tax=Mytilus coruscus TaxID=42192 RepID=A0A6J8A9V6_MYTCO|nr:GZF1 [Mytilus coruscus]
MCLVFDQTDTLLLPSFSTALNSFLCNPECELFEKLKSETRVRISQKNTESGVNYLFSGRFVDIIRANEIIHTFTQQLSVNINDSLSESSTLVLNLNEKQKSSLLHREDDESDFGNSNCQIKEKPPSGIDINESGTEILKCCNEDQRVKKDRRTENTEQTYNKDHVIALKDAETTILSDFVSSKENEKMVNREANASNSTSVIFNHDIQQKHISNNFQNVKVKDDTEPTDEKDCDEKLLTNLHNLQSDDISYNESKVESSGKEIVLGPDKYNEDENNYPFNTENIQEEKSLSNPCKNKKRKRKNPKTCKVDVHHPDVDLHVLPEESKDFKGEESVFVYEKNVGKLIRDNENPAMAKSECGFCSYVNFFPYAHSKKLLKSHFRRNHAKTEPIHKCELCSRSFCTKEHLYNHKRQKHIFKKCETCGIVVLKNYYPMHIRLHQDGNGAHKFECDICKRKLASRHSLQQHLKKIHMSVEERELFTCETCKKSWLEKRALDRHMKIKHGEGDINTKEHLCDICGKGFETAYYVKKHKQVHDKVPQHVCDVCFKAFKFREGLHIHMKTHTGAREYLCKDCGKTFTQLYTLKRHQRIHTGERPFVCSLCKDTFNDQSILRRHMILKHKKEK